MRLYFSVINSPNKRFKRDSQRVAFLLCVGFCGYVVMRKVGRGVGCPLSGRYEAIGKQDESR
ncbi:hypothetical protein ACFJ47_003884 [Vibrio cholerae]